MSNTDKSLVKDICQNIKLYRQIQYPDTKRMDFYIGITDSEDIVSKIESGRNMPKAEFLLKLSKKYNVTADYFVKSGFHFSKDYSKITNILDTMAINSKYQFMQKINYLKCEIFTTIDPFDLKVINIYETGIKLRGKILHNTRIKRNMTIPELSRLINRAESTIARMEDGSGSTSLYTWIEISKLFHIPIDYFLFTDLDNYEPSVNLVIDYLIHDTFYDLDEEQRNLMYSIATQYKHTIS